TARTPETPETPGNEMSLAVPSPARSLAVVERQDADAGRARDRVRLTEDDPLAVCAPLVVGHDLVVGRELLQVRAVGGHHRQLGGVAGGRVPELEEDAWDDPEEVHDGRQRP